MNSIHGRTRWGRLAAIFGAAAVTALQCLSIPAFAGFELPPGERITNLPAIPRNMPQKEAYELYDPVIGRNFDIKNLWMRADLRVRPEMRNNTCFGGGMAGAGACNSFGGANARGVSTAGGNKGNDMFVQQWMRLGIGYDLSPDVNFYVEIIDSANWGSNGSAVNAGNGGDPLTHNGASASGAGNGGRLGVRAAYMLVRNLADIQGLSMKVGRQYVIFGNHSLFGHFDWANTGYSHDGVMFSYTGIKNWDMYAGWFRNSESDLGQASAVGSAAANIAGTGAQDAQRDADLFIFYNQLKMVPGMVIEPFYVLYQNRYGSADNATQGLGTAKHSNQTRHMIGNRLEVRKGGFDFSNEIAWQFGQMGQAGACVGEQKCLHINAWATRNWIGYTFYDTAWKTRLAFNLDYASGDSRNNSCASAATCKSANTFENFFPTNHIHMGYMDVQAWKNMLSPSVNLQARPSARDHIELWYTNLNLANSKDCWYRGAQGCYVFSNANNTKTHIGDEIDVAYTRMFADGKVALQAAYGTIFAGGYLTSTLNQTQNQHWAYMSLWMNF